MQNPVIQRIKRRAEVCQSLPVTCGRRGNDTGNDLVTVRSLQCAVDCFLKNGKSSHSKPFTFSLPPSAKCRQGMFFTLGAPYVCHAGDRIRDADRHHRQDSGPYEYEHDTALCEDLRGEHQSRDAPHRQGSDSIAGIVDDHDETLKSLFIFYSSKRLVFDLS